MGDRVVTLPLPGREVEDLMQQLDTARSEVYAVTGVQEFMDAEGEARYRAAASKAWQAIKAQANADAIQHLREALSS